MVTTPVCRAAPRCTLVASKIDYTARSGPDVFSPATARHASPHYRCITPVIYERARRRERSATALKMKVPSATGGGRRRRRSISGGSSSSSSSSSCRTKEKPRVVVPDKMQAYLFSPRNLYVEYLSRGYDGYIQFHNETFSVTIASWQRRQFLLPLLTNAFTFSYLFMQRLLACVCL